MFGNFVEILRKYILKHLNIQMNYVPESEI